MSRTLVLSGFIALSLALAGCIEESSKVHVHADGSGKMVLRQTIKGEFAEALIPLFKMAEGLENGQEDNDIQTLANLTKSYTGATAWSDPKTEIGDKQITFQATAWFDDINSFKEIDEDTGAPRRTFTWTKAEGACNLKLAYVGDDNEFDELRQMPEEERKAMMEMQLAMLEGMLKGFEMRTEVTGPGAVTEVTKLEKDGDTAKLVLDMDKVKNAIKTMQAGIETEASYKVEREGRAEGFDEAFKAAKEYWAKKKEAVAKKIEEDKAEDEGGFGEEEGMGEGEGGMGEDEGGMGDD